ncbi:Acetyltransferase Pat [Maioricimonas rarisocia]|uniref:Acetyltransferase Pat n=2 Tax=Maioricimonas rarisocia TaxID=2528026 RepID=A0A517Z763_9PLAN|nr:Acetyltransferase Pat [Maioricimonas rarisocia]
METDDEWIGEHRIDETTTVRFRHVRPDDAELIAEAIRTASPETILHRFFTLIDGVPPRRLRGMLTIDRSREACIVGVMGDGDRTRIVCGARYIRGESPDRAEIAVTVHDDVQHRGLGTFLLRTLSDLAHREGVREFEAWVLPSNVAMLELLRKLFPDQQQHFEGEVVRVTAPLNQNPAPESRPSGQ